MCSLETWSRFRIIEKFYGTYVVRIKWGGEENKTCLDFCIVYKEKGGVKFFEIPIFFVNQKLVVLHRNKFMFTIFEINLVLILPVAKCL